MLMQVKFTKISPSAKLPYRATPDSAGADLFACVDDLNGIVIQPHETVMIGTGLRGEFASGYVALLYARSGMASKKHLAPANKVGVIDADYRGEWMVPLHNHSNEPQIIENGERIAQVIFHEIELPEFVEVEENELSDTQRSTGGIGSTGTK